MGKTAPRILLGAVDHPALRALGRILSVVINEAALAQLFNSTVGPIGQLIALHADRVRDRARQNASGEVIGVRSGDLLSGLSARVEGTPLGVIGVVGSSARHLWAGHEDFAYPAVVTREGGTPGGWLIDALRDEFPA